ncbi:MAG: argininosuccinate lyase [Candidatus Caldarchaeum sp.]|nr:argininosuccinate lyase [Candidatus Caldarchaeum sp.]MDW8063568.1 argininosuccinate lyase [Candidatus Caldarchaeum sp.]MDW8435357.1 argininosuccinate lyase [Candidatus Caldarchaeum sp.]
MEAPHRGGMLSRKMDEDAARYTSSSAFDKEIFEATVYVNAAHIKALEKLGVIKHEESAEALKVLRSLLRDRPEIPQTAEDIHIFIESLVSKAVPAVGEMLALGKSRNDAVVAAVKLEAKRRIYALMKRIFEAVEELLNRSMIERDTLFPVYTHLQKAAPATFGFVLQSYGVRLLRSVLALNAALDACEECPLGSAAVAGTSIPIDRRYIAETLGFKKISVNALEATASRDFLIGLLSALLQTCIVLSSFAEEMVLYSSEEFGVLSMPEEFSATSSIMPQKRNPVVAEIMRTKTAELLGLLTSVTLILTRQPSGYNLDLQQTTPKLWKAVEEVDESIKLLTKIVKSVEVVRTKALEACGPPTAAVEVANTLSMEKGVGFRTAHQIAAKISKSLASKTLDQERLNEIFREHGLEPLKIEEVLSMMDPVKAVSRYVVDGSANPVKVAEANLLLLSEVRSYKNDIQLRSKDLSDVLERLLG